MNPIKRILGHIYFFLGMTVFFLTMLLVWVPIFFVSRLEDPKKTIYLHQIFKIWMDVFLSIVGCPVKRTGINHFKDNENYVVICNHNSFVDIPVSSPYIPGPNKTLAKSDLKKVPLFGMIYTAGSILVERKSIKSRKDSAIKMIQTLEQGLHLCLYPEGSRNKTQQPLQPFFDGAFITAIKAQKDIIPAVIFNTGKILPFKPSFWAWPHTIYFDFLPPISVKGKTIDDVESIKMLAYKSMHDYYISKKSS